MRERVNKNKGYVFLTLIVSGKGLCAFVNIIVYGEPLDSGSA